MGESLPEPAQKDGTTLVWGPSWGWQIQPYAHLSSVARESSGLTACQHSVGGCAPPHVSGILPPPLQEAMAHLRQLPPDTPLGTMYAPCGPALSNCPSLFPPLLPCCGSLASLPVPNGWASWGFPPDAAAKSTGLHLGPPSRSCCTVWATWADTKPMWLCRACVGLCST